MSRLLARLAAHAKNSPDKLALSDGQRQLGYAALSVAINTVAAAMNKVAGQVIALQADNGIDWILADLAAISLGKTLIPIPHFFSQTQRDHVLAQAGVQTVLSQHPVTLPGGVDLGQLPGCTSLHVYQLACQAGSEIKLPAACAKITFTSGSTGQSKGVCLSLEQMENVAQALQDVTCATEKDRHLCLLPLATLLENIAGVYLPLMAGASCIVPPLAETGLQGSSSLDVQRQLACLSAHHATTAILVPQMLLAQLAGFKAGIPCPPTLRFVAVGGGRVSPNALHAARACGLPVYEGYGLSEAASVVSLNHPAADQAGSVGKPLAHIQFHLADDGEIILENNHFLGYLGDPPSSQTVFPTGDIGELDQHGFLKIVGRKKQLYISSFGRNISPEWIESEYQTSPGIRQIAVFGDGQPYLVAVVVPMPGTPHQEVEHQINQVNLRLPDYARIRRWISAEHPFLPENQQLTYNGRVRRDRILIAYASALAALY